jgi:hypothetical protein
MFEASLHMSSRVTSPGVTGFGLPPRDTDADDPLSRIVDLWRSALAVGLHGPFCSCFGGMPVMLDAATLEADVLDYLKRRYEVASLHALAELVAKRQRAPEGPFLDWLKKDSSTMPAPLQERLHVDVERVLKSIGNTGAQFRCE